MTLFKNFVPILITMLWLSGCAISPSDQEVESEVVNDAPVEFVSSEQGDWGWYEDTDYNSVYAITENTSGSQLWVECFFDSDIDGCIVLMTTEQSCTEDEIIDISINRSGLTGTTQVECWGGEDYYRYYFEDYDMMANVLDAGTGLIRLQTVGAEANQYEVFSLDGARKAISAIYDYFDANRIITDAQ